MEPGSEPCSGSVKPKQPIFALGHRRVASPVPGAARATVILTARLRGLALAELDPPDLAAGGLRQLVYELYLARVLVRGGHPPGVVLEVFDQFLARLVVGGEDHVRLY